MPYAYATPPICVCGARQDHHSGRRAHSGGYMPTKCKRYSPNPEHAAKSRAAARQQAAERIEDALSTPGVTYQVLECITGLTAKTIRKVITTNDTRILDSTYNRIMRITGPTVWGELERRSTLERLQRETPLLDVVQVAQSLCALGWNPEWQAARYGRTPEWVKRLCEADTKVLRELTSGDRAAIRETAGWVDAAPLRMETCWGPDLECAKHAKQRGWHPLAAYNDYDGEYAPTSKRSDLAQVAASATAAVQETRHGSINHGTQYQTIKAQQCIEMLRLSLREGLGAPAISAILGVTERTIERWRKELGLRFSGMGRCSVLAPGCEDTAFRVEKALIDYDTATYPNAVATLQSLGMLKSHTRLSGELAEAA